MSGYYTEGDLVAAPRSASQFDATAGEAFEAGFEEALDYNPVAIVGRQARYGVEDLAIYFGVGDLVDQKTALAENKRLGLDLKIPTDGISRVELDWLQTLKQKEIRHRSVNARIRTTDAALAGFAGGLLGSAVDPINVGSSFIPFVAPARTAAWLARAGTGTLARAGVRAGVGAVEGAAGAAVVEPIVYFGSQAEQADYGVEDSFLNVTFGATLGAGLHVPAGAVYDWRGAKAGRSLDDFFEHLALKDAAAAPESAQLKALELKTAELEGGPFADVKPVFLPPPAARTPSPPRSPAKPMPEGTLARLVQDKASLPATEQEIAAFRNQFEAAGGEIGPAGPDFKELSGDYYGAILRLADVQDGIVRALLHHPHHKIREIAMIWGVRGTGNRDGRGLAKIIAYHPEVIDELPEIIANLKVIEDNEKMGRMILADDIYTAVIDTAYIAAEGAEKKRNYMVDDGLRHEAEQSSEVGQTKKSP